MPTTWSVTVEPSKRRIGFWPSWRNVSGRVVLHYIPRRLAWSTVKMGGVGVDHVHTRFDFLGFSFRARTVQNRAGKLFPGFGPAVSQKALKRMTQAIRSLSLNRSTSLTLAELARCLNPMVRGWVNYYGAFYPQPLKRFLIRIDLRLGRWARNKYKRLRGHKRQSWAWLKRCRESVPQLFAHWDFCFANDRRTRRAV